MLMNLFQSYFFIVLFNNYQEKLVNHLISELKQQDILIREEEEEYEHDLSILYEPFGKKIDH